MYEILPMSLPIHILRKRLLDLIKLNERGYMATLSERSGVPDGTIHRIAYGKQKTVTYKIWKQLYDVEPELPPPQLIQDYSSEYPLAQTSTPEPEKLRFAAALRHFFPIDEKYKTFEDLALSVGLTEKNVKCLFADDFSYSPTEQQKTMIAHAFGMSLDEFLDAGQNILAEHENSQSNYISDNVFNFDRAVTTHPEIVQIVNMAEKLNNKKIHMIKELTLKLFIAHMNGE